MRILHVVPTYAPAWRYGGPIHAVHGLCRALVEAGHDVTVLTTAVDGPTDLDVPLNEIVERDGVKVRYFASRSLRRLYWSPGLGAALDAEAGSHDVVHAHSVYLWPTWRAARAARAAGTPYVVSPRGMLVAQLIQAKSALVKRAWIRLVERGNLAGAAAIHVTSGTEQREMEQLGLDLAPVRVVPNGIDLPSDTEVERPRLRDTVLYLGRISWKKRIDRLIAALALRPGTRLVVAGNDEEGLLPRLRLSAHEAGVASRVEFVGHADATLRRELLASAGVLALPSLSENFGNVVVEALAMRCPVIVTPEVGAAEIVAECRGGVVTSSDAGALAEAIATVLDDPERAREMGARGAAHVRRTLAWPAVATRMAAVYDEAAGSGARGAVRAF